MPPTSHPSPTLHEVAPEDINQLRPLLESCIGDTETGAPIEDEISDTLSAIEAAANGDNSRLYVVAKDAGGRILGIMGLTDASKKLEEAGVARNDGNSAELINAFTQPDARGQGVGKLLAKYIESMAKELAFDEIVVTSGPRYRDTGWGFWSSLYGQPVATVKDAFGPGIDAPAWRKQFRPWNQ